MLSSNVTPSEDDACPAGAAATVFVNLGTNERRVPSLRVALELLQHTFGEVHRSSVYESEAVGFEGEPFFNMTAAFATASSARVVARRLRDIEACCGRDRTRPRFSSRTLDADLLLYGDAVLIDQDLELPRPEILTQAHVLGPLAEVAGARMHPLVGRTFAELWSNFGAARRAIRRVSLDLQSDSRSPGIAGGDAC